MKEHSRKLFAKAVDTIEGKERNLPPVGSVVQLADGAKANSNPIKSTKVSERTLRPFLFPVNWRQVKSRQNELFAW